MPGFGDHDTAILTDIICQPKLNKPPPRIVFMWKRANIEVLKTSVKNAMISFIAKYSIESPINNLWLEFKNTVNDLLNRHVPNKLASSRFTQPWITRECKKFIRRKKRSYNRFKRTKLDSDWSKYLETVKKSKINAEIHIILIYKSWSHQI